jgi:hypothetical protein
MIVLKNDSYLQSSFLELNIEENILQAKLYGLQEGKFLPLQAEDFNLADYILEDKIELDMQKIFKPNSILGVMVNKLGKLSKVVDLTELISSRDGLTPMHTFYYTSEIHAFTIYFNNSSSEYVLVSFLPTKTNNDYELRNRNEILSKIVEEKYPESEKMFNRITVRKNLMFRLDPNNSLAYFEAQLDILSQVVFLMLDNLPDVKNKIDGHFPQFTDFKTAIDEKSVLTVKGVAKCLEEIQTTKSLVRQLQNEYYAIKQQNQY